MSKTHYELLGIASTATEEEIKLAYRQAALRLHPDKAVSRCANDSSQQEYLDVQTAWQVW